MHANYACNNKKRDNVKIIRIVLDLHDAIVDSIILNLLDKQGDYSREVINRGSAIIQGKMVIFVLPRISICYGRIS